MLLSIVALASGLLLVINGLGASTLTLRDDPHAVVIGAHASAIAIDSSVGRAVITADGRMPGFDPSTVSILDLRTHTVVRTVPIGVAPHSIAIDMRDHRAFITSGARAGVSSVSALDAESAAIIFTLRVPGTAANVAVDEQQEHLFVTTTLSSGVMMYDVRTGDFLRRVTVGDSPGDMAVDEQGRRVFVVNTGSGTVSALDAGSGHVLWTSVAGEAPISVLYDAHTKHVFVTNIISQSVAMLNAQTGQLLGTRRIGGIPKAMGIDTRSGHVFVIVQSADITGPGSVSIFNAASGQLLRTIAIGAFPTALAVDNRRGIVVVTTGSHLARDGTPVSRGQAHLLDARTGRASQAIGVGIAPNAVAVDEQSEQAIVLNGGASITVSTSDPWGWLPSGLRHHLPFLAPRSPSIRWMYGSASILALPKVDTSTDPRTGAAG